jgi:2-dehydro-3-deoxyglucarate aldolase
MTEPLRDRTAAALLGAGGAIGSWCGFASFSCVEAMTLTGFDFLILDMQHSEFTQSSFPAVLGAFPKDGGTVALVRAAQNDYHLINWLFDQGVPGVMVPMVNSPELARRAVEAAKFPPLGRRSFGPFRAARYGAALDAYMAAADDRATVIVQIEHADAAADIDAILNVAGIDAVFMGPNDLAYSMLSPGEAIKADTGQWAAFARTPEVLDLCAHVMARCRAANIPFGMTTSSMDDAKQWLDRGASFVTYGSDFYFLRTGALASNKKAITK